jgi:hypothetical protein
MPAHRGHGQVRAVRNAPEVDARRAERAPEILQVVGALDGGVAAHRHPCGLPAGQAGAQRLGVIAGDGGFAEDLGGVEPTLRGAGRDVVGQARAPLVQSDDVGDFPELQEDLLARPAGRRDP